jgi:hypothetical protein
MSTAGSFSQANYQRIMTTGESALFLDEEAVVSRITAIISDKLYDRIYHVAEMLRPLLYF